MYCAWRYVLGLDRDVKLFHYLLQSFVPLPLLLDIVGQEFEVWVGPWTVALFLLRINTIDPITQPWGCRPRYRIVCASILHDVLNKLWMCSIIRHTSCHIGSACALFACGLGRPFQPLSRTFRVCHFVSRVFECLYGWLPWEMEAEGVFHTYKRVQRNRNVKRRCRLLRLRISVRNDNALIHSS